MLSGTHFNCAKIGVYVSIIIDIDDLFDVLDYLGNKHGKCYEIGSALGLDKSRLARIQSECLFNANKALRVIISNWLKQNYDTARHGPPTWKALVKAIKSPFGGDDPELAERIARDHPVQSSEHRHDAKGQNTE